MNEMFDFESCEKKRQDAFAVIGYAIRKQYPDEKIPANLARVMAKIIDDGFLDCVLENHRQLIRHNENLIWKLSREVEKLQLASNKLSCDITWMERRVDELREEEEAFENSIANETDHFIVGAKKAYHFIEQKTHDAKIAAKAFNSYLLMNKDENGSSRLNKTKGEGNEVE